MSVTVEVTDNGISVDFTCGITDLSGATDTNFTTLTDQDFIRWDSATSKFINTQVNPVGATTLAELSDVVSPTPTNRYALVGNGSHYITRALVEADIIDLQGYLLNVADDLTPQFSGPVDCQNNDFDNAKTITFNSEIDNAAASAINWNLGQKQKVSPVGATTYTFQNPTGPCNLMLKLVDGATNNPTWPVQVIWPNGNTEPNWTTGTDLVSFYFDGTTYYGSAWLS